MMLVYIGIHISYLFTRFFFRCRVVRTLYPKPAHVRRRRFLSVKCEKNILFRACVTRPWRAARSCPFSTWVDLFSLLPDPPIYMVRRPRRRVVGCQKHMRESAPGSGRCSRVSRVCPAAAAAAMEERAALSLSSGGDDDMITSKYTSTYIRARQKRRAPRRRIRGRKGLTMTTAGDGGEGRRLPGVVRGVLVTSISTCSTS